MTCKDCIHFEVCNDKLCHRMSLYTFMSCTETTYINGVEKDCKNFKDKSKIIELPCKIGDTLYFANKGKVTTCRVIDIIHYGKSGNSSVILQDEYDCNYQFSLDYRFLIGYKLFTAREEAEKALEEKDDD